MKLGQIIPLSMISFALCALIAEQSKSWTWAIVITILILGISMIAIILGCIAKKMGVGQ